MNPLSFQPPVPLPAAKALLTYTIDLRDPESFSRSHLKGSVNIPWSPAFSQWAYQVVPKQTALALISLSVDTVNQAAKKLWELGFENLQGYILIEDLRKELDSLQKFEELPLISPQALADKMLTSEEYVIDVRTLAEWNSGHINGAHHIELSHFAQAIHQLPKEASISIICGSGFRASIAASLLQKLNFPKVANVSGGMQAWKQAGLK